MILHRTPMIHYLHMYPSQGLMQDYQLLVLQEGEVDMFQYFSTILYVHFRNYRLGRGNQYQGWEIPVLPTL